MEERLLKNFILTDKTGALKMNFGAGEMAQRALPVAQFPVPTWQLTTGTLLPGDLTPSNQST